MGRIILSTPDPIAKSKLSHWAYANWCQEHLPIGVSQAPSRPVALPNPTCQVSPKEIPSPKGSGSGLPLFNACMLHNLAHVELNASDLAWDTVVRFSSYIELLGEGFFADDESRHFTLCSQRLAELGFSYGELPAHSFLWRECERSSDNVSSRLAVIPLVQEARELDAGPRLVDILIGFGDQRTSRIVSKIADEEVAHMAIGIDILKEYHVEQKGPFNHAAREAAGVPRKWYDTSPTTKEDNKLSEVYERLACIISV